MKNKLVIQRKINFNKAKINGGQKAYFVKKYLQYGNAMKMSGKIQLIITDSQLFWDMNG